MALPLPNLDDRTYEQLVAEMIELLPRNNKEWTNQNASDPGVMLLELFAYLIEMDIFQLNRIPLMSYVKLLNLVEVDVPYDTAIDSTTNAQIDPLTREKVEIGIKQALTNMAYLRAIAEPDIRTLIEDVLLPKGIISRAFIYPDKYIKKNFWETTAPNNTIDTLTQVADINKPILAEREKDGYTLILLSVDNSPFMMEQDNPCLQQVAIDRTLPRYTLSYADMNEVREKIRQRRMLTDRIQIHQARICRIILYVEVLPVKTANLETLAQLIRDNLLNFFCPVWGGGESTGFAVGRSFKISEVIAVLEETEGVDFTENVIAWYEDLNGQWQVISQVFKPEYYEQIWLESGPLAETLPNPEKTNTNIVFTEGIMIPL